MIKWMTSGESHGQALTAIIEGLPSNLKIDVEEINKYLALRQSGYGRGARQKIETDKVQILSGVRNCLTLGSPVCLMVENKDYKNWEEYMSPYGADVTMRRLTRVRPGHADLSGVLKYDQTDARNILERASARETAVRVAAGTVGSVEDGVKLLRTGIAGVDTAEIVAEPLVDGFIVADAQVLPGLLHKFRGSAAPHRHTVGNLTVEYGKNALSGGHKTLLPFSNRSKIMIIYIRMASSTMALTFSGGTSSRMTPWLGEMTRPVGNSARSSRTFSRTCSGVPQGSKC